MSKQPDSKVVPEEAIKELFDYACRELSEAKESGRQQDRQRFFELARAIEAAFPSVSLFPSPMLVKSDGSDGGTGSVH